MLVIHKEENVFGVREVNCFVTEENNLVGDIDDWLDDNYCWLGDGNY